jgi:hypothetical protein
MNKLRVAVFVAASAFGASPVLADDTAAQEAAGIKAAKEANKAAASQAEHSKALPTNAEKRHAVDEAAPKAKPWLFGDFWTPRDRIYRAPKGTTPNKHDDLKANPAPTEK